jgi:hypothetical protein
MKTAILKIIILILVSNIASALEYEVYTAYISKHDLVSSSGVRLTSAGSILQQDRANYHKFKKRDDGDTTDGGFFSTAENRAKLAAMIDGLTGVDEAMQKLILKGNVKLRIDPLLKEGGDYISVEVVE